ncbi:MAG: hypothetical protein QOE15_702 [Acidimicrobiaceae bacterium]|nr:hypothetical protein [Acidimicrobiaceae bacterium]
MSDRPARRHLVNPSGPRIGSALPGIRRGGQGEAFRRRASPEDFADDVRPASFYAELIGEQPLLVRTVRANPARRFGPTSIPAICTGRLASWRSTAWSSHVGAIRRHPPLARGVGRRRTTRRLTPSGRRGQGRLSSRPCTTGTDCATFHERRWTGIEPAGQGSPVPTALKAAEPTRYPDTSAAQASGLTRRRERNDRSDLVARVPSTGDPSGQAQFGCGQKRQRVAPPGSTVPTAVAVRTVRQYTDHGGGPADGALYSAVSASPVSST